MSRSFEPSAAQARSEGRQVRSARLVGLDLAVLGRIFAAAQLQEHPALQKLLPPAREVVRTSPELSGHPRGPAKDLGHLWRLVDAQLELRLIGPGPSFPDRLADGAGRIDRQPVEREARSDKMA